MDKKKLAEAISKALEDKGKKKFKQSVEIIINMRGIDFSKSENRLNLDIVLPKGKGGKELKSAVFADGSLADEAKKAGADLVIAPDAIPAYAEPSRVTDLADNYFLLAQPNLMGVVAKSLGQYLGKRGKLPKPITGNVADLIKRSKNSIRIVSKGKYLPVAQALIGTEIMGAEELVDNAEAVYDAVKNKVNEGNIKSVYVKLTMSKPIRVF
ncbi:50S ribosomal protein L1 [Candidatus Bilamarchaeum dharawalense]|uniref:Ribosomal protein n=1 Tax=Candidatus Bilamarchaeum dharawalense TaxID=2885759 RepID=A0A5E4LVB0_9ARCH|nr:50S ribosomal protein L1 [Candidatus Bilamarchaeum dharawalense]